MIKTILMLTLSLLLILSANGDSPDVRIEESNELTHVATVSTSIQDLEEEKWKEAYAKFLNEFQEDSKYTHSQFSWWDLDNNDIPELIIEQANIDGGILTVYSYDGNAYEVGNYSNSKIGVSGLRFSNNPEFPGLFTLWWGGGVEHYGYLTVNNRELIYEDLWYMDGLKESYKNEISDNKKLINESINVESIEDSLLEMYLINEDGINEITK